MSTRDRYKAGTAYDPELVKYEVVEICDYYLRERRKEGRRFTYRCPGCGGRRFEVEPVRAMAGCFSADCGLPKTTDALGIIAYMEGLDTRGPDFVECLGKGYEILGLEAGEDLSNPRHQDDYRTSPRRRSWVAGEVGPDEAMTNGLDDPGSSATAVDSDDEVQHPGRLIEAYTELPDGSRERLEAFVVDDDTGEIRVAPACEPTAEQAPSAPGATVPARRERGHKDDTSGAPTQRDQREINHKVFERLLGMCRLEERDQDFLRGRGLDEAAIRDGRFGSISKKRCRYVTERLERRFPDEELLTVPGFYRADSGQLRFTLYGEYVLIPYYDREGYIRTVEGRLTGEPARVGDPKYKALAGSGVHLYVHPRFEPGEVVAFCEGAIGAMVAARCGLPVASIKGMRNYRQPPEGRHDGYSVLPELTGVNFGGREIVYIPDLDVKPKTREEALGIVPGACEWLIERQGGRAKVALLPQGAKDLDEWLLSLAEEDRVPEFMRLIRGAMTLEEWDPKETFEGRDVEGDEGGERSFLTEHDQGAQEPRADGGAGNYSREEPGDQVSGGALAEQDETTDQEDGSQANSHEIQGSEAADSTSRSEYRNQYFKRLPEEAPEGLSSKSPAVERDQQAGSKSDLPEQNGTNRYEGEEDHQPRQESFHEDGNASDRSTREQEHEQGNERPEESKTDTRAPAQTGRRADPGMQWWYEVLRQTPEQDEENRRITEVRERVEHQRPRGKSVRLELKKWNFGEVAIAGVIIVSVAIAVCAMIYIGRIQEGLLGTAAGLIASPVWWIEAAVYLALGWGVALQVSTVRYVARRRQLLNHARGKKS